MAATTFFWHDYETWGADPMRDRPSQFAGLRTDADLNVIGEPLVIHCRPTPDALPHPEACLITGITPQQALEEGMPEAEFMARIHEQLSQPGTCGVGYNSIRFDDEVTRHGLYRNFFDPYAREWQHGNSRWDLIDVVRLCAALRPQGLNWPLREDGTPSFRLEQLTAANGLDHQHAHDALSDVTATIALARLLRTAQPRLFDYALSLRFKHEVARHLDLQRHTPVLHVSGRLPASRYCTALVMPLMAHPTRRNSVIVYDLDVDPAPLLQESLPEVRRRLYSSNEELGDVPRIALKEIHLNRSPMVATVKLLDDQVAARTGIDRDRCRRHWQQLHEAADLMQRLTALYAEPERPPREDPDLMLYGGPFFSDHDRGLMEQVRVTPPEQLGRQSWPFQDGRLEEMLWRYRARNWPETLSAVERRRWMQFCRQRLLQAESGGLTLEQFRELTLALREDHAGQRERYILSSLLEYAEDLEQALILPG